MFTMHIKNSVEEVIYIHNYKATIIVFAVNIFLIIVNLLLFPILVKINNLNKAKKILLLLNTLFFILNVIVLFILITLTLFDYFLI